MEVGPAVNYPAKAAADACGVLLNMDLFAANFFEHGAVKVTLLTVTGKPAEAETAEVKRLVEAGSDWHEERIRSEGYQCGYGKPIVIGEGMKELENVTIGEEKREEIAIAMGIPMSNIIRQCANYATAQQDELNFLNQTIIPLCAFIESDIERAIVRAVGAGVALHT